MTDAPRERPRDPSYVAMALALVSFLLALGVEVVLAQPSEVTPITWFGRGVLVVGSALTLWARGVMGGSYAPTAHHPRPEQQEPVRRGPYRLLRHPQYLGNLASLAGLVLALGLRWTWFALLPFLAALAYRVRLEERYLEERFGEGWRRA